MVLVGDMNELRFLNMHMFIRQGAGVNVRYRCSEYVSVERLSKVASVPWPSFLP